MKNILIILILQLMGLNWLNAQNNTLIYIGDPMCSWCYGFAPEITKIKQNHPDIEFRMIMGGLRPFNTQKISEMTQFLKEHWEEINHRTNQQFSYDILTDPNFIYDTEPAARAVVVARNIDRDKEFDFFKAVQITFYAENKKTNELSTYLDLAEHFNMDQKTFRNLFHSTEIKEETKQDFALANQMGIGGFPSLVLKQNDKYVLLSNGYRKAEEIEDLLSQLLK